MQRRSWFRPVSSLRRKGVFRPRIALTLAVGAVFAVAMSGCIAIKSESASQPTNRGPGLVTLHGVVCAADRNQSHYSDCVPDNSSGKTPNTDERDNGFDADEFGPGEWRSDRDEWSV